MAIDYFSQLNALARDYVGTLTPNDFAVYMRLLFLDNNLHWEEWFTTTYERLCIETCIKKADTIQTIINRLEQRGFIEVRRGGKHKPNFYKILPIYKNYPDERDNLRDNSRDVNKTKTNTKTKTETKTNKGADAPKKKFVPPTLDEVNAYVMEKGLHVVAKDFWDYFDAGNWVDSKGQPVRNWKQKMLTWEKFHKNDLSTGNPQSNPQDDIAKAIAYFESQEGTE